MNDVAELGSILGIWAHPDDEAWSMSGLMIRARANGQKVHLVTATKGEAGNIDGSKDCDRKELAHTREREMKASLECIGGVTHQWLEYHDGQMKDADEDNAVRKLVEIIKQVRPNTIVTFEPQGITGHEDHRAISRWTKRALEQSTINATLLFAVESRERYESFGRELDQKFDIYFNVPTPFLVNEVDADSTLDLSNEELARKLLCLRAHHSQTSHMFNDKHLSRYIDQMASSEVFVKADSQLFS